MDFVTIKVRGVILKGHEVFLCSLSKYGFYCLPGGTLERGETLIECLKREIKEELGVDAEVGKLVHINEFFKQDGTTCIDFWYEIKNFEDFENIDLSKTSHGFELDDVGFFDLESFDGEYKPADLQQVIQNIYKQ